MITLKGLDFTRSRNWLMKGADCQGQDPISAFIFVWISLNHYYSTFALEYDTGFNAWRKEHFNNREGDKAELVFLVRNKEFSEFLDDYKRLCPKRFDLSIKLPVINMLHGTPVPKGVRGPRKLSELTYKELFLVIYQIRNNLFHGSKDLTKNERDLTLCTTAAEFMVPLVASLIDQSNGEVLNAYDNSEKDAREQIRRLAEC